jgi:PAS domain S-box-containing protein
VSDRPKHLHRPSYKLILKRRDDSYLYVFYLENTSYSDTFVAFWDCLIHMETVNKKVKSRLELENMLEGYPALQQILHNIQQVVWLVDQNTGQILFVSPAFETVWGRPCESFYADPLTFINSVHPEDRVKVLAASPDKNRNPLSQTYRILRPDGNLRWVSAHIFLIGEEPEDTSYEVCIAQDITDQNQVDQTLRKALDRSREQFTLSRRMSLARKPEAVLKTLMSAAELRIAQHAFVLFFDTPPVRSPHEGEIIASWSSASYQSRLTTNPAGTVNEASFFEELALSNILHSSKPVIVSEISTDERLSLPLRNSLLEGQFQSVAIFPLIALGNWLGCLFVLYTKEKHFDPIELRHIKVLVDQATITLYNLQLLEIEAESRHEAERANEIKTRFLAMISHELRTPLTSIKGFTTTLLAEDVAWEPEEQRDFILTIQQEANRLQELIDHLLDLSRLEAGMLPIALAPNSLQGIIEDALPQFEVMGQKHVLTVRLPDNLPPIMADGKRLAQVLVNLVHNAVLYSPVETEVIITASVRGGWMRVNVTDQGPGIPPSEHKRVFQAFHRGSHDEDGAGKGAGLGLAICKGLVEAHGGKIWIKKQNAPGMTISLTIPLAPTNLPVISTGKA